MRSIGIDVVEIARFSHWHNYCPKQLLKLYTPKEITYCLSNVHKTPERFAAHFALKEAAYKALCSLGLLQKRFIQVAQAFELTHCKITSAPQLIINNQVLSLQDSISVVCSLTHTKYTAYAIVIVI